MNFLLGNSLAGDTTSDHYRSFTDPEGQEMLYHALERDRRFFAGPKPEKPETDPEREVWAFPDHPGERGELSADLHVKAGHHPAMPQWRGGVLEREGGAGTRRPP